MANEHVVCEVRIAWWFGRIYVPLLVLCLFIVRSFGVQAEANPENIKKWLKLAMKTKTRVIKKSKPEQQ